MKHINGKKINNMVGITHKPTTLRKAIAVASVIVSSETTIAAIKERKVPKGDVFEFSRAAGLLAIKKTSDVIPDCHPLPIEFAAIQYTINGLTITVRVEVHTIYKTGVEVEAMHGAAVTALTMYDMLKPIDKNIEISSIRLETKTGGKSDLKAGRSQAIKCAVIVCSDSVSAGKEKDLTGPAIVEKLNQYHLAVEEILVIPDQTEQIQAQATRHSLDDYDLVLFAGGTGLSHKDVTPDALLPLINKIIPGITETMRQYGQQRTPYSMLSRGVAGLIRNTLVLTLPGSVKGATESLEAIFPHVLHVFDVIAGSRHEG